MQPSGPPAPESPRGNATVARIGGRRNLFALPVEGLHLGVPLLFPIYDAVGRLLLRAGEMIENERQLETLRHIGLYREPGSTPMAPIFDSSHDLPRARKPSVPEVDLGVEKPFAQLKLPTGTVLHLDFLAESGNRPRVALRLVGYLEYASVVLSAINVHGMIVPFREGDLVQVKVIAGNDIGAFTTLVQKVAFVPFPMIFVGYPAAVQMKVLRKHARIETRLIVAATREELPDADPLAGVAVNLSASGMRLEVPRERFAVRERVRIGLRLPAAGEERTLSLTGTVRTVNAKNVPDGQAHCGIEFDPLAAVDRLVLEHYVFQGLLEV